MCVDKHKGKADSAPIPLNDDTESTTPRVGSRLLWTQNGSQEPLHEALQGATTQWPPLGGFPELADLYLDLPFQSAEMGGCLAVPTFPWRPGEQGGNSSAPGSGTTPWCGMYRCIRPTADTTNCFLKGAGLVCSYSSPKDQPFASKNVLGAEEAAIIPRCCHGS